MTTRLIDGSPGGVLVAASRGAGLLVVGHRGLGGFAELLAGSVGVQAAGHAHCPVVVRGEPAAADAPIVVGVDGSPGARAAVSAAFGEAHRRGAELFVVHLLLSNAVRPESRATVGGYRGASTADPVAVSLQGVVEHHGDVKYHTELVHGDSAAMALMATARRVAAGLLVVGSRGLGGFRGMVMGSTSRGLIDHAPCPVLVVPRGVCPA